MRELRAGLWQWQVRHPEWTPGQRWPQEVSSCAIDDGERLLLFDPLAVPDPLLALAGEREPVIVLTAPWHERDTRTLVERLDADVFAPPCDTHRKVAVALVGPGDRRMSKALASASVRRRLLYVTSGHNVGCCSSM